MTTTLVGHTIYTIRASCPALDTAYRYARQSCPVTDGHTYGQTDGRAEHRDPHGATQQNLASAPGPGRTAPYPGPNTGDRRGKGQGIDNGLLYYGRGASARPREKVRE